MPCCVHCTFGFYGNAYRAVGCCFVMAINNYNITGQLHPAFGNSHRQPRDTYQLCDKHCAQYAFMTIYIVIIIGNA